MAHPASIAASIAAPAELLVNAPASPVPTTPSVQSRALAQLLMTGLRPIGDRLHITRNPALQMVRDAFDAVGFTPLPRGTELRSVTDGDVRGVWITGRGAARATRDDGNGVLLYLHGGGFVFGSRRTHRHFVAALSAASGRPAFLVDYRRAPEHPFPAAADDAVAAYRWLLASGYRADQITVLGDSAGGHLTAGLLADLSRRRLPMPAAAVLFPPFLDLTCAELDDRDAVRRDPFVPPRRARECGRTYAGEHALDGRRLNVLRAPKRRWPPVLIQVGDTECLLGDSERMAESIRAAGGHCELQVWPGQVHVFPAFYPVLPEGRAAIRYVGEFLRGTSAVTAAA
ncbi:alpha/beta hydrolase [Actinophytocola sp.]|uniref:alpha/beta hydrolase n=1 Tax=Actinophytocola sp. TaxID=1872138 RepID=UPI0025BA50C0|nr:alpha/beta hydrolase [Actinophytocola sp.]